MAHCVVLESVIGVGCGGFLGGENGDADAADDEQPAHRRETAGERIDFLDRHGDSGLLTWRRRLRLLRKFS